jgi:oligopeptide transport system substrate-binding protein
MATQKVTRREFIRVAGIAAGAGLLSACAPQVVTQVVTQKETQVVVEKQTEMVEKEVIKEVTPTPQPMLVTPQGRELPGDAAPLEKQVLHELGAEPKFLDVARDIYSAQFAINWLTEPLLRNNENFEIVPALAESWKPGEGAEYWEFVIREGAQWSDGTPITADDVVYTYQHLSDPALANPWVWFYFDIKDVGKHARGEIAKEDVAAAVKVDDRTVQIFGEFGSIPFLPALLSYQASVIVPKHAAEKDPEHWADNAEGYVGGGPYICTEWVHNQSAVLEVSPTYNGPHKPGIQRVEISLVTGTIDYLAAWQNQEIEIYSGLSLAHLAAVRSDPQLNPLLHFFNNFQSEYIALNTFMAPTDNLALRQALSHSIDRETMCFQVMNGTYLPGYSMLPPNFPGYNPDLKEIQKYDLELAMQKLTESGLDPATIKIELVANARDPRMEFIKEQWETNLGITVDLVQVEGGVWGERRAAHDMMAYKGPYEYDFLDPSIMLTGLWRSVPAPEGQEEPWGSPRHAWKNETFDKLVTDAGGEADVAKRIQMFQDAEKLLCEEVGGVFITHQVIFQVWGPWIVGMHPDKSGNVVYRYLDISRFQMYVHKDVDEMKQQYM